MATKYENFTAGDDAQYAFRSAIYAAQTFTPSTSHTVTSVKLELAYFVASFPDEITISIRATAAGKTTGSDLCSGTMDGGDLTVTPTWYEIMLGGGYHLDASSQYAIVAKCPDAGAAGVPVWRKKSGGGYTDGTAVYSADSGVTWDAPHADDHMFEEWGGSGAPVVTTQAVDDIEATTATGHGTITVLGNATVTQHGHCWNTSTNPTTSNDKTTKGTGSVGPFISAITSLSANTLYYVRAYATNSLGTAYGANITFTSATTDTPVVETKDCIALTGTTATGVGIIWSIGGSAVTQHGHCWNTSINPTTSHGHTLNGDGFYGAFTSAITGLTATTSYYIRAYATNTQGTSYGNNVRIIAGVASSELAGPIAVVQTRFHYVDKYGVERYVEGTEIG